MTGPTFLVVGGARCGTTGLVEGLRTNPRVFVTDPKEPHYFALHRRGAHFTAPGDQHTINRVSVTDRDAYLALYPDRYDYLALGDASVSTMYYFEDSLPEVVAMNPAMRLVVLLREPVDRAFSAHQYMRARGLEPVEDFLDAVGLEPERRDAGWHHIWHYTAMSRYADAIAALQAAVPPQQLKICFYDDLNSDFAALLREVFDFLGVPVSGDAGADIPRVNISGQPRYKAAHAVIGAITANERLRSTLKRSTSYRFRERVRRAMLTSSGVPAAARAELAPLFEDDLSRVRALLDQPLPTWLDAPAARI
jgi:Sulfotransferase family